MAIELRDLVYAKTWFTELSDKGSGNIYYKQFGEAPNCICARACGVLR